LFFVARAADQGVGEPDASAQRVVALLRQLVGLLEQLRQDPTPLATAFRIAEVLPFAIGFLCLRLELRDAGLGLLGAQVLFFTRLQQVADIRPDMAADVPFLLAVSASASVVHFGSSDDGGEALLT